jgi:voltage-gated potassium channel
VIEVLRRLFGRVRHEPAWVLVVGVVVVVLAGAAAFSLQQHLSFGTGIYWAIETASTVGYGDVVPKGGVGRAIAVLVMITAIPLLAGVFSTATASLTSLRLRRLLGMDRSLPPDGYVLVYGRHAAVPGIVEALRASGSQVVVVAEPEEGAGQPPEGVFLLGGDPTDERVVRRSRPSSAARALVTGDDDADVLLTAVLVRHEAPELPIIALAHSERVTDALADLGIEHTLSDAQLVARAVATSLQAPHAADLVLRILAPDSEQLVEVPVPPALVGRPLRDARAEDDGVVLGAVAGGRVVLGLREDPILGPDDRLLVLRLVAGAETKVATTAPASGGG